MRASRNLIAAYFIFLLLKSAAAAAAAGSNQTGRPAFDLVAVSSRLTTNASASPNSLKLHNSAATAIDTKLMNDERSGGKRLLPLISDTFVAVRSIWHQQHPADVLKQITILSGQKERTIYKKLTRWIKQADKYHARFGTFDDAAVFDHLMEKLGREQLEKFLNWLFRVSGMKNRALTLREALAERSSVKSMFPQWLALRIRPDEVYRMMPIAKEGVPTSFAEAGAAWPAIRFKIMEWFAYGDEFGGFSDAEVFGVLIKFRGKEEVLRLSTSLSSDMKGRTDKFQVMLFEQFPEFRPTMIDTWLKLGKTPQEVFELMSVELDRELQGGLQGEFEDEAKWTTARDGIMELIGYTDKFMARSILFSRDVGMDKLRMKLKNAMATDPRQSPRDELKKIRAEKRLLGDKTIATLLRVGSMLSLGKDKALVLLLEDEALAKQMKEHAIAMLLTDKGRRKGAAVFFNRIRDFDGMKSRADTMQQWMLTRPVVETERLVFDLWKASGLSPEEVYHMMPFASEKPFDPAVGRGDTPWFFFCLKFMQWMKYVYYYNSHSMLKFGNAEVARVLKENRHKKEIGRLSECLLSKTTKIAGREELAIRLAAVAAEEA